jgi:hypothetical protein
MVNVANLDSVKKLTHVLDQINVVNLIPKNVMQKELMELVFLKKLVVMQRKELCVKELALIHGNIVAKVIHHSFVNLKINVFQMLMLAVIPSSLVLGNHQNVLLEKKNVVHQKHLTVNIQRSVNLKQKYVVQKV